MSFSQEIKWGPIKKNLDEFALTQVLLSDETGIYFSTHTTQNTKQVSFRNNLNFDIFKLDSNLENVFETELTEGNPKLNNNNFIVYQNEIYAVLAESINELVVKLHLNKVDKTSGKLVDERKLINNFLSKEKKSPIFTKILYTPDSSNTDSRTVPS